MKATGRSLSVLSLTTLRPSRCCRLAKGCEAVEGVGTRLARRRDHDDELAVERDVLRQVAREALEVGIGVGDQLFAARP